MLGNANIGNHIKDGFDDFYKEKVDFQLCENCDELFENSQECNLLIADFSSINADSGKYIDTAYAVMSCDKNKNPDFPCFELYQNVHDMYNEFLNIISEYKSGKYSYKKLFRLKFSEISVFFSCGGGAGATTVSKAYALNKSKKAESVYVPFMPFSDEPCDNRFSVSEILSGKKSLISDNNSTYSALNPLNSPEELQKLDFSIFDSYEKKIYVCVDADFSYIQNLPYLLNIADKIFFVVSDKKHNIKMNAMKKYAESICRDFKDKITVIHNYSDKDSSFSDGISINHINDMSDEEIINKIQEDFDLL